MKLQQFHIAAIIATALVSSNYNPSYAQDMNNDTLTKKERGIVPIAALTAKGDMARLDTALNAGLDAGLKVNDIKEVLTGLYAYVGFPRSLNALNQFMSVLDSRQVRGIKDEAGEDTALMPDGGASLELGTATQTRLSGAPVKGGVMEFAPAVDYYLKAHLFGDIFGRDNIPEYYREIATLSALSALEGTESQLRTHLRYASNSGLSEAQIYEIPTVLKMSVGEKEAWRAAKVMGDAYERKYCSGEPIDDVFPRGRISTADFFSGTVWNQRIVSGDSVSNSQISNVTFDAGARTRWHKHTGTQILLCTTGYGWYQERGEKPIRLKQGDSVVIRPGVVHWHGASAETEFSHLSIIPNPSENRDTWLEEVDETKYQSLKI